MLKLIIKEKKIKSKIINHGFRRMKNSRYWSNLEHIDQFYLNRVEELNIAA